MLSIFLLLLLPKALHDWHVSVSVVARRGCSGGACRVTGHAKGDAQTPTCVKIKLFVFANSTPILIKTSARHPSPIFDFVNFLRSAELLGIQSKFEIKKRGLT